jgi:hypothetical protein
MSLLKSKTKVEYVTPEFYKDWGNATYELESLGRRLDAVRATIARLEALVKPEDHWALVQWRQSEAIILRKWKHTIRLKETGLRQAGKVDLGPKISYDWWEPSYEPGMSMPFFDKLWTWLQERTYSPNYNRIWEIAKEEKLQKARQGLA